MTLVMHMNDWHSTIWASPKQITVNFCFTSNLNRHNIFIRAVHMHVEWLTHSRIWASQSNWTVIFCFTSNLHRHYNIVIRVVHMHIDGCSSRGAYNNIIVGAELVPLCINALLNPLSHFMLPDFCMCSLCLVGMY